MNHRTLGTLASGLICVLLFAPVTAQSVEDLRARLAALEAANAELTRENVRLQTVVSELEDRLTLLRQKYLGLEQRATQLDQREAQLEVMAGAVTTGEYAERFESLVTVTQDAERQRTVVTAGPLRFDEEPLVGDLFLSAVYSLPGNSPVGTPETISVFVQGKFTGNQFAGLDRLTFDIAGEALTVPVATYEQVRKRSGIPGRRVADKSDETVTLVLDLPAMRRLAEAPTLTMPTPLGVVTWQREQRALLRALLTRMEATDR